MQSRRLSTALFAISALSLAIGFGFLPAVLGLLHFRAGGDLSFLGEPFASGRNYFPSTISEMAADPSEPAAQIFAAFGVVSSVLLLASEYPWRLRNVYLGGTLRSYLGIMRHVLPPFGCLVLVGITVTPKMSSTDAGQRVATVVHSMGAGAMFGTYIMVELYTVLRNPTSSLRILRGQRVIMKKTERKLRIISILGMMLMGPAFMSCFLLSDDGGPVAKVANLCCSNTWVKVNASALTSLHEKAQSDPAYFFPAVEASHAFLLGKRVLENSASGPVLVLRIMSFVFEVMTGFFMVVNMMVIWWFSYERLFWMQGDLPGPSTQTYRKWSLQEPMEETSDSESGADETEHLTESRSRA